MGKASPFALMTVVLSDNERSLTDAATALGVRAEDLDAVFGVVPIDPERRTFAVQIRSDKVAVRPPQIDAEEYRGPWANPPIAPLGPIEK